MAIGAIIAIIATVGAFLLFPVYVVGGIWLTRHLENKEYNQTVPGYGMRMVRGPYKGEQIAKVLNVLVNNWIDLKNHDRKKVKKQLDRLRVEWLRGTVEDGVIKRYIIDSYGRKIAGDHQGNKIRVVYLDSDSVGDTGFVHECFHELKELEGSSDGTHSDTEVWSGLVNLTRRPFR